MIDTNAIAILFGWVALAAVVSWAAPNRWQLPLASACGAALLASLSPISLLLLVTFTITSYGVGKLRSHQRTTRAGLIGLMILLYGYLLWASTTDQSTTEANTLTHVVLPFGMAYYILRLVHYLSEIERGTIRQHSLLDYVCYQFFAPTLAVGPVHRFDIFLRDLRRRRWDADLFNTGLSRILMGATKIILLGNYLLTQKISYPLMASVQFSPVLATYIGTIIYWLNIYIQFGGYSDIAIGAGAIMGFHIPENFNLPFMAANIGDFWRRWHMTLSNWCRDYVYMPMLARFRRPLVAFSASMIALGLWHAISLHYILWGFYHAIGLTVWRRFEKVSAGWQARMSPRAKFIWHGAARIITLNFVISSYPIANAIEKLIIRS